MTDHVAVRRVTLSRHERSVPERIAESVLSGAGRGSDPEEFGRWLTGLGRHMYTRAGRVPLDELAGWRVDRTTGNVAHRSGKFFTVEGLEVHMPQAKVPRWDQPIINQPEVGILGILVKNFDGVLHCLMQAKAEPGNCNGLQLSPTVQATRSNYTRVHSGKSVPYLDFFRTSAPHRVLVDVRQSEQGSWFYRKRNRNMVIETTDEVPLEDGFCWLTLGEVHRLLAVDNLVNVDARTVLSCLPFAGAAAGTAYGPPRDAFHAALIASLGTERSALHTDGQILSWITDIRTRTDVHARRIPLNRLRGWRHADGRIAHESGLFFDVIGVDVTAGGREVGHWMQPMIEPVGQGLLAFVVKNVDGVLHVLVQARAEPGLVDVVELAPTVQCTLANYQRLPGSAWPRFLPEVLGAEPDQIRFDTILSEEGGRFYHARNRYLVVEAKPGFRGEHPDFRWLTLHQLAGLLRHSYYLNIQARSLVACLHSLCAEAAPAGPAG
ncbi:NDP-hexose 2,3-dehydratase family protein [Micromonospora sp. NPDC049559]|uniref:NDP-hexose 2,3-dehydratase family protein n=1 Tax=Micromonospora sp. NPDC049559 TaxID=3155923 RepID=UPI003440A64D